MTSELNKEHDRVYLPKETCGVEQLTLKIFILAVCKPSLGAFCFKSFIKAVNISSRYFWISSRE